MAGAGLGGGAATSRSPSARRWLPIRAVDCRMWAGAVGSYVQRLLLNFMPTFCDLAAQMRPARAGDAGFPGTTQRRVGWSCEDSLPPRGPVRGNGGTAGASWLALSKPHCRASGWWWWSGMPSTLQPSPESGGDDGVHSAIARSGV